MTVLNQLIAELLENAPKAKQYTEDDKAEILIEGLKGIDRVVWALSYSIQGLNNRRSLSGYMDQCYQIKQNFYELRQIVQELNDSNLIENQNHQLARMHRAEVINSLKKSINTAIEEAIN